MCLNPLSSPGCRVNATKCMQDCMGTPMCMNRTVEVSQLEPYWQVGGRGQPGHYHLLQGMGSGPGRAPAVLPPPQQQRAPACAPVRGWR